MLGIFAIMNENWGVGIVRKIGSNDAKEIIFLSLWFGQVLALLSRESAHKLLILAGQSVEESGDLLFHKGLFSPHQLKQILTEKVRQRVSR